MRLAVGVVVLVVLASAPAIGGGTSFGVRITALRTGGREAVFVVDGSSEEVMPGCRVLHITSRYQLRNWPWSRQRVFTREAHREALRRLNQAYDSRAETRFGLMGSGLAAESGRPCAFRSRALAVLEEEGGGSAVYSLHKDP